MIYEYTEEVAGKLRNDGVELISCFMYIRRWRISFSPFKKYLYKTEFYDELKEWKPKAPYFHVSGNVLAFLYKNKPFKRISYRDTIEMLQLIVAECRKRGIKHLLLPIKPFLVEGIALKMSTRHFVVSIRRS